MSPEPLNGLPRRSSVDPEPPEVSLRNEPWVSEESEIRLRTHFPGILERLNSAVERSNYDRSSAHFAAEHILTTEALVELLEEGSARPEKVSNADLESAFQARVVEKVSTFQNRPTEERQLIKRVYSEIDPDRILLARERVALNDKDTVSALQQSTVYFSEVIPRLAVAGLLPDEERAEIPEYLLRYAREQASPKETRRGAREN